MLHSENNEQNVCPCKPTVKELAAAFTRGLAALGRGPPVGDSDALQGVTRCHG